MSDLMHFAQHRLQEAALVFMGLVYTIRLIWLFRFKGGKERQPPTGLPGTTKRKGILYSWAVIGMPWVMESTRKKLFLYSQFVVFHIGVAVSIIMSFLIPYAPGLMKPAFVLYGIGAVCGPATLTGIPRIIRRAGSPHMRAISTPDDYFSLILLTVWMASATGTALNRPEWGETVVLAYFFLTAFFLIYVPFSKISHYLYYPFTRMWFGRSMGHRGTYPLKRGT